MTTVYHFTDTARLPWILGRKLSPGANKIGGFPDPDFLWGTTDARGDGTCSADRGEHYRSGKVRHVRFTLPREHFFPWSEVTGRAPEWTPHQVARLEAAALGKSDPRTWWCCPKSLGKVDWGEIHTRSYRDNRWLPFDPETEVLSFADQTDGSVWRGVGIGLTLFMSKQVKGWNGAEGYQVQTIRADAPRAVA